MAEGGSAMLDEGGDDWDDMSVSEEEEDFFEIVEKNIRMYEKLIKNAVTATHIIPYLHTDLKEIITNGKLKII